MNLLTIWNNNKLYLFNFSNFITINISRWFNFKCIKRNRFNFKSLFLLIVIYVYFSSFIYIFRMGDLILDSIGERIIALRNIKGISHKGS